MKPRNIFKFQNGNTLWYNNLIGKDFDVNKYVYGYNTSKLVDGDMSDTIFKPWASPTAGYDKGRYVPTTGYGDFGVGNKHYTYTKGVENQPYYTKFGQDLLDESGNFTPMGLEWAKAVDALIPQSNHQARFFDDNGKLRTSWYSKDNDAHGRAPKVYNNLRDYVNYVRNDQILGARHNVFLNKGKRYFYKDKDGVEHWVDPELIKNYNVSENPVRSAWNNDHTVYWDDYELIGPSSGEPQKTGSSIPGARIFKDPLIDWNKLREGLQKIAPNILAAGRLAYALDTNKRMLDEQLAANKPQLQGSYHTYHQVTGDEGSKQAYYRRAAQGQTSASRPFTSNADRQMAYQMEARRIGDEARAQGDLIDNQEIRRTSELSKQHSDANIARDNQVANANYLSLLQSQAQKHLLKNNYLAANHSSWNNYLLGLETRMNQKQAERQALEDQIYALDAQNRLLNDKDYQGLYDRMNEAYNSALSKNTDSNGNVDYVAVRNDPEFKQAQLEFQNKQYQLQRRQYSDMLSRRSFAKDGMKISYKKKDDLLYKTARDTVEHFRKMVKMSDDSMQKSFKKPLKLIKPPKSTTRKMQTGGVAPFVVYTPTPLGGETTTSASSDGVSLKKGASSTKKDKDSTLDTIKDLFKNLEGLPSDVNHVYQSMQGFLERSKAFGTEINSDDLASIFLQQMHQINNIKFSKRQYDSALKQATDMDALGEFAVTSDGRFVVQDSQKDLTLKSWEEIKKSGKYTPLTNNDLLNIRAYDQSGKYILGRGDASLLTIVNSGIGMSKIADFIKANIPEMGTSEKTIEGYTKKQSQQIQEGFKQLLQDAPDGDYHWSQKTEDQKEQIKMAFAYINSILPKNMKAVLKAHSDINGITPDIMLQTLLGAKSKTVNDLKFTAVTGKAAKDANGNSKTGGDDGLKLDAPTGLITGKGYQDQIEFNPGTSYAVTVNARHSGFQKTSGENMGSGITMQEATTSTLDQVLDWNKATLGGSRLNPTGYNRIVINNNDVVGVDLPVGKDKNKPDFEMLKKLQLLDQELLKRGIEDTSNNWQQINQICQEVGLPSKYKSDGHLNDYSWNRFAAFQVTTDDSVLTNKDAILDDVLGIVEDDNIRSQYEQIIQKDNNKNYKLGSGFLGFGKQALYQGTVFVPIKSNLTAAALSGGQNITMSQATDLELRERGYDQSKVATYKPAMNFNEL